jgi:hypothetical protein
MAPDRVKMSGAIGADFLENLKLAGVFAEGGETFGAKDFFGKGIQ